MARYQTLTFYQVSIITREQGPNDFYNNIDTKDYDNNIRLSFGIRTSWPVVQISPITLRALDTTTPLPPPPGEDLSPET